MARVGQKTCVSNWPGILSAISGRRFPLNWTIQPSTTTSAAPQKLVVYGPWGVNTPEGKIFLDLIKPFEKKYNVVIEYTGTTDYSTEAQQMTSGTPPFDVVVFAPVGLARQLAAGGYLTDLTPYLQSSGLLSELIPYYLEPLNVSGRIYGVPVDAWSKPGIYAYVPTMQKYGISMPTAINERWSWDQFLQYIGKLKGAGVIPVGTGAADQWPLVIIFEPIAYSLGGKDLYYAIMCHKISYTSPIVEQAFEFYLSLVASGAFGPTAFAASQHFIDVYALMKNGTVAMYFMGDWTPFFNKNYTAFMPIMAPSINPELAGQYFVVSGGDWALVPKNAPHNKTLAIQFALWLASK
ncbi:MAG: extracellular solute-binding protein, partial [Thermoproteus sp.]|nr:extracellular solute-binding protein [Thermoproteus sp.]